MTTLPANSPSAITAAPRPAVPAVHAPPTTASIDLLKLLNKHKWLLVGAAVLGGALGVGAHLALRTWSPKWSPSVLFKVLPPQESMAGGNAGMMSPNEMDRFMQTELRVMTSDTVLSRVAEDPQLQSKAPDWAAKYTKEDSSTGRPRFDFISAAKALREIVGARAIPQTNLMELSVSGHSPQDATEILGLVRQKYTNILREQNSALSGKTVDAFRDQMNRYDDQIGKLASARRTMIETKGLDALDERVNSDQARLANFNVDLQKVQQSIEAAKKQLEQYKQVQGSGTYSPELLSQIEKDPNVMEVQSQISRLETARQTQLHMGHTPDHRDLRDIEAQLAAAKQNLDRVKAERLPKMLSGGIDSLENSIGQLQAQEQDLMSKKTEVQTRLVDLTQTQSRLRDVDRELEGLQANKSRTSSELQDLLSRQELPSYNRVVLLQPERTPTEMSFPKLKMMIPMGVFVCVGLVGGLVFLREIVDQRVKGPSDITIIPRTRLLGWVPDAAEDPAGQGATETAFRDRSRGIVAEAYRQLRGGMAKRLHQSDHRTVLITAGMPGSGATSATANLAFAYAAAEKRVLIIDANFRRPALHRVMGLQEGPGLADVLARTDELSAVIQSTSTPGLDLLSAGSKDKRVYERLATEAMTELLAKVRGMYDMVLIDCAPAAVAGDASAIAHRCDASILVVRAMSEKRGMIARIKNELIDSRSDFLGVIVNAVRSSTGGYMRKNIRAAHEYHQS